MVNFDLPGNGRRRPWPTPDSSGSTGQLRSVFPRGRRRPSQRPAALWTASVPVLSPSRLLAIGWYT